MPPESATPANRPYNVPCSSVSATCWFRHSKSRSASCRQRTGKVLSSVYIEQTCFTSRRHRLSANGGESANSARLAAGIAASFRKAEGGGALTILMPTPASKIPLRSYSRIPPILRGLPSGARTRSLGHLSQTGQPNLRKAPAKSPPVAIEAADEAKGGVKGRRSAA